MSRTDSGVTSICNHGGLVLLLLLLLISLHIHVANADANFLHFDQDVLSFYSRPDIQAPVVAAKLLSDRRKLSDGYFFLAPWSKPGLDGGPYIYDNSGDLVWAGAASVSVNNAHSLQVCNYGGAPHICFFEGLQDSNRARGHVVIIDDTYRVIKTVQTSNGRAPVDMHELNVQNEGKSVIVTYYQQTPRDLSNRHLYHSLGWILRSGFQEIDIATGEVLFDWDALDHIDVSECEAWDVEFAGKTRQHPWDYFHLNSVDKTVGGDYIISGRHSNTLYKISGVSGRVTWRLGGSRSTFKFDGFKLGYQHHARIINETPRATTISLFNNGWDSRSSLVSESSYGAIVKIDHETNVASILQKYETGNSTLSGSQGSMQLLGGRSKNVVVGWGSNAYVTEHSEDGTPLLNLTIANNATITYRAHKAEWVGRPTEAPALWTFARSDTSAIVLYVSWNGATEVASWRFHGGATQGTRESFDYLGETSKQGFETRFVSLTFCTYAFAEAMSSEGVSLANSTVVGTFMPGSDVARFCSDEACPISTYTSQHSSPQNDISPASSWINDDGPTTAHPPGAVGDNTVMGIRKPVDHPLTNLSLVNFFTGCLFLFNTFQFYGYLQRRYKRYGGYRKVILG